MPDPRSLYFVINERQNRWGPSAGEDRRPVFAATDAEPLPVAPTRERWAYARRLAVRLRVPIRSRTTGARARSGQGPARA